MNSMTVRAIILDYNGTLADDNIQCWETTKSLIEHLSGETITYEEMRHIILNGYAAGVSTWLNLYRSHGVTADEMEIAELYYQTHAPRCRHAVEPFPDAHATLQWLTENGFSLGIVTGFDHATVLDELSRMGFDRYFSQGCIIGNRDLIRFDKLAMFKRLLATLEVDPQDAVAVGDSPVEMRAARELGMRAIGFLGGWGTVPVLHQAGAERCIRKLSTLQRILRRS